MDLAYRQSDWEPTADGQAILRNNKPLLAYIGGRPEFTSKDHNFFPGETVEKQIVVINNSRNWWSAIILVARQPQIASGYSGRPWRDGEVGD